jgi:hypothetical protein
MSYSHLHVNLGRSHWRSPSCFPTRGLEAWWRNFQNCREVNTGEWSVVKCSEVMWSEVMWYEVKWYEVKWSEVKWCDMKWSDMKWSDVKWSDVMWYEVKWYEVKWCEVKWCDVKWSDDLGWNVLPFIYCYVTVCRFCAVRYLIICIS